MKMGRAHHVPLSPEAINLLRRASVHRVPCSDLIFPGQRLKRPLSDMTLPKVLRDMEAGVTVHGFRSAFLGWAAEEIDFPGEVAEAALAHAVSNKVEAAYRRTDFLAKRRTMKAEWGDFYVRSIGADADVSSDAEGDNAAAASKGVRVVG